MLLRSGVGLYVIFPLDEWILGGALVVSEVAIAMLVVRIMVVLV